MRYAILVVVVPILIYSMLIGLWVLYKTRPFSKYAQYAKGGIYDGYSPRASPNGKMVVYSSPSTGRGDIYTLPIAGGSPTQLTRGNAEDRDPCFTPDGKSIVFVRDEHLWMMTSRGGAPHPLVTAVGLRQDAPVVSPDGTDVMFVETFDGGTTAVGSIKLSDRSVRRLSLSDDAHEPTYDPNGSPYYVSFNNGNYDQIVHRTSGGQEVDITTGRDPAVSPDGKLLAYVDQECRQSLWLSDVSGRYRHPLTSDNSYKSDVRFLPDSRHVIYLESTPSRHSFNIVEIDIRTLRKKTLATI